MSLLGTLKAAFKSNPKKRTFTQQSEQKSASTSEIAETTKEEIEEKERADQIAELYEQLSQLKLFNESTQKKQASKKGKFNEPVSRGNGNSESALESLSLSLNEMDF
jgi:hypothetical protein